MAPCLSTPSGRSFFVRRNKMKLSNSFFYTIRDEIKDEDSKSGSLLVKSGLIKKEASGIYMFMPMGMRVKRKIEDIIRYEMDCSGASEVLMPALIPSEIFKKSGRYDSFGGDMFRLKDRYSRDYILGPTHEELFLMAAQEKIKSYRDMPFNIYQIQDKFRDEARPRYGLIRTREFTMKDAYSFDVDSKMAQISYDKMVKAYQNSFDKMKIDYRIVRADTGLMGGDLSEEFQAVTEIGEDTLVLCDKCDFGSNIEVASVLAETFDKEKENDKELIATPNVKTIEDIVKFLNIDIKKTVKTLIYNIDGNIIAFVLKGDRELNETKIQKLFKAQNVSLATDLELKKITDASFGSLGPVGLNCKIVIDNEVANMVNFVCGANKTGYHFTNVNLKDFDIYKTADIVNIKEGDKCPKCGGHIYFKRGIEIGNTFKLGTKYSEHLNLNYLDENNNLKPVYMGSYGIGIARCMSAIAEQNSDEKGLIWPISVAPFTVSITIINVKDNIQNKMALNLYDEFNKNNIDVLLDDRDERAGVKFKDMDLIGIPIQIVVGKKAVDKIVELKTRDGKISKEVKIDKIFDEVKKILR
jgi:prolyl-tRNA synthetase